MLTVGWMKVYERIVNGDAPDVIFFLTWPIKNACMQAPCTPSGLESLVGSSYKQLQPAVKYPML